MVEVLGRQLSIEETHRSEHRSKWTGLSRCSVLNSCRNGVEQPKSGSLVHEGADVTFYRLTDDQNCKVGTLEKNQHRGKGKEEELPYVLLTWIPPRLLPLSSPFVFRCLY
jgi:hypothetical protein